MRRPAHLLAAFVTSLTFSAAAPAAPPTVCPSGCAFSSIQAAIDAAAPGDTVLVATGEYVENLVIAKPLTLRGSSRGTVIYPALSAPTCGVQSSLCPGASNMILVQAANVTIRDLRLEGDNPALTSGVMVGGVDVDARNGIITDHRLGTAFDHLVVRNVKISDVYLRGIYASSGGSFEFRGNVVDNVQGEYASIAMFNFGGAGVMADNKVTNASDAISANWSTGTVFERNDVGKSSSGIHTDNNDGTADQLIGNTVHDCKVDGYGVWVFAPYVSATVRGNRVQNCYVGLAAFSGFVAGEGPRFIDNVVDGDEAKTTDPTGTYGVYVTTDLLGWSPYFSDVTVTMRGNSVQHFDTGLYVTQLLGGTATVDADGNTFQQNGTGAFGDTGTAVSAQDSWWGCKQGPNSSGGGCDTALGTVDYTPWSAQKL